MKSEQVMSGSPCILLQSAAMSRSQSQPLSSLNDISNHFTPPPGQTGKQKHNVLNMSVPSSFFAMSGKISRGFLRCVQWKQSGVSCRPIVYTDWALLCMVCVCRVGTTLTSWSIFPDTTLTVERCITSLEWRRSTAGRQLERRSWRPWTSSKVKELTDERWMVTYRTSSNAGKIRISSMHR